MILTSKTSSIKSRPSLVVEYNLKKKKIHKKKKTQTFRGFLPDKRKQFQNLPPTETKREKNNISIRKI